MTYVIAEIGFNHEGDADTATEMIAAAARAGADAVKFQTFRASDIVLPTSDNYAVLRRAEMSLDDHLALAGTSADHGIDFLSTPFSVEAVNLLEQVGVGAYKIASMDCMNHHLLARVAQTGKPIFLSTGMATLDEIGQTVRFLDEAGSGLVTLMHCLSLYPAEAIDINLATIPFLHRTFNLPVGYSDHLPGTDACLGAVMMGAQVIETHFTLDTSREGGDHGHSADPDDLGALIRDIARFETMRGHHEAANQRPDRALAKQYRRGIYAARDLKKGERINEADILLCRPPGAFGPNDLGQIIGRTLVSDLGANREIEPKHLSG